MSICLNSVWTVLNLRNLHNKIILMMVVTKLEVQLCKMCTLMEPFSHKMIKASHHNHALNLLLFCYHFLDVKTNSAEHEDYAVWTEQLHLYYTDFAVKLQLLEIDLDNSFLFQLYQLIITTISLIYTHLVIIHLHLYVVWFVYTPLLHVRPPLYSHNYVVAESIRCLGQETEQHEVCSPEFNICICATTTLIALET